MKIRMLLHSLVFSPNFDYMGLISTTGNVFLLQLTQLENQLKEDLEV